jgi:hypothetical protein
MVLNLTEVENAYRDTLNYSVRDRGQISSKLADNWDASDVAGQNYLLMQPESNESVYLRFIESSNAINYQPMKTEGWNAIEILAQDPDDLAHKLDKSKYFTVVGEPDYLTEEKNIKAMQALGPASELLYFTHISAPEKSGFGLLPGKSYVDRVFIMVIGSRDHETLRNYYQTTFDLPVTAPMPYRIGVLSNTYGLPEETKHNIAIASISNRFLIELDQYPQSVQSQSQQAGQLPPGIAIVTFEVENIETLENNFIGEFHPINKYPYTGRASGVLRGPAGELIEIVQQRPDNE